MAEIEHFCNPNNKDHPKFEFIQDMRLPLFPRDHQKGDGKIITPTCILLLWAGHV